MKCVSVESMLVVGTEVSFSFDHAAAYADANAHGGMAFPFRNGGLRNLLMECRFLRDADEFATSVPFNLRLSHGQYCQACQSPN